MAWCPNCKTEYREGIINCSDCGAKLISKLPKNKADNNCVPETNAEPVFLISVTDEVRINLLMDLLRNSGIPFITRDRECGAYLKIAMGSSIYGTEFYVDKNSVDRAKELIDAYFAEQENSGKSEPPNRRDHKETSVLKTVKKILIIGGLLLAAASVIYGIIENISRLR
ncbi:MAG: DUF2007 domain-containing protein [Bacillota bacterium]|nr:DUF2007 domain-containing protein [Bacillota bacterium]